MFVPRVILDYFGVNLELVRNIQSEVAALRAERDILKQELTSAKLTNDWLRIQFNDLQAQNKALLEKAYNIKLPVPELQIARRMDPTIEQFSFDDMGDEMARKLGLPTFDKN